MNTVFSLILYAPKQITHVQTVISEHDRNGAKWEVGHIAIYLTKRGGGGVGERRHGVRRGSGKKKKKKKRGRGGAFLEKGGSDSVRLSIYLFFVLFFLRFELNVTLTDVWRSARSVWSRAADAGYF